MSSPLNEATNRDATVHELHKAGHPLEEIILSLVVQKEDMMRRIMELESIAPRKIIMSGITMVWNCPSDLLPESRIYRLD